jgi:hypothetical protein
MLTAGIKTQVNLHTLYYLKSKSVYIKDYKKHNYTLNHTFNCTPPPQFQTKLSDVTMEGTEKTLASNTKPIQHVAFTFADIKTFTELSLKSHIHIKSKQGGIFPKYKALNL